MSLRNPRDVVILIAAAICIVAGLVGDVGF